MDLLKTMESFVRVVRAGSFAAAAEQLNVSRAIVSKHIQHLERHLSARLLNRSTRSLSLTEIGRSYHDFCIRMLAQLEQERETVAGLQSDPRGALIVIAPKSFGNLFVSALIAEFVRAYPRINLSLFLQDGLPTCRDLIEKGADVAIRISPLVDSSMISKQLGVLRWIACAAPSYLKRHGRPLIPEDLHSHKCLLHLKSTPDGVWSFTGPAGVTRVKVAAAFSANSSLALRAAAAKGIGVALLPVYAVKGDLESGSLIQVLPDCHGPERPVVALYPHRPLLPNKIRLLINFLEQKFKDSPEMQMAHYRENIRRGCAPRTRNARNVRPLRIVG